MGSITLFDWTLWLVYLTLIIVLAYIYRTTKTESQYNYFIKGLVVKVLGGLAFALVYVYYYKFGDTFLYHKGASVMATAMTEAPIEYFRLLLSVNDALPADLHEFSHSIEYSRTVEEWFMVKLLSPLYFVGFSSYLTVTLLTSIISFFGAWKLFLVFRDLLPKYEKYAFYAVFITPTVVFWGGGIMKDTITLSAINIVIYFLYFGIFKGKFNLLGWVVILFCSYLIFSLKAYVLIAFIPGVIYAYYLKLKMNIGSPIVRFIMGPALLVIFVGGSFYGIQTISESSAKYNADNLKYQVKGFHTWHTDVGGSTYSLGDVEYTAAGVVTKIPEALNVTFFRPYLWESRNIVVFISAIESALLLVLFLMAIFKAKFRFFKIMGQKPILIGFFIYSLIFGFAVGFTSYNFGALARYKIPVYALFVFVIAYVYVQAKEEEPTFENE